ncbi:MAG: hypothetical protein RIB60_08945 [Phycisphaerales bacterium]
MPSREIQTARNDLRRSLARWALGNADTSEWVGIADRLTTLGVDTPVLIELVVNEAVTVEHEAQTARTLVSELRLQPDSLLEPRIAAQVLGVENASQLLRMPPNIAMHRHVHAWLYQESGWDGWADRTANERGCSLTDAMDEAGLGWLYGAEYVLDEVVFNGRTDFVYGDIGSWRLSARDAADWVKQQAAAFIERVPEVVKGPA